MSDVDLMREAMQAMANAPGQLAGFGVERVTERDGLWLECLSVLGDGRSSLSSNRSFGDSSGEEIGWFQADLAPARVAELMRDVEAVLPGGPTPNLSPGDVRVTLSVVAAGARWERVVGGAPPDLEPYQPMLRALDALAFETRASPLRTLALDLQLGASLRAGRHDVPVKLTFENRGRAGYWLRNPSTLGDEQTEHVRLWYAARPPDEPGVTALPVEPVPAPLEPAVRAERPLIWLAAGGVEARSFTATLELDPGEYFVRASFASYGGGATVAGQPHLRGCVFSQELEIKVT